MISNAQRISKERMMIINRSTRGACLAALAVLAMSTSPYALAQGQKAASNIGYGAKKFDGGRGVPLHPDETQELKLKITQPFTAVAVGDLLEFQPFAHTDDPRTQALLDHLRKADVTMGDFENEIYDFDNFGHVGGNLAPKEVADDWADMGIDIVSRANNKRDEAPQIWENFRQVERVGIKHVGVAHSLEEARMARYVATPQGLVGVVGVSADGGVDACCSGGTIVPVTAAQLTQVAAIKQSILARRDEVEVPVDMPAKDEPGTVDLFGLTFRLIGSTAPAGEASGAEAYYRERKPGPDDGIKNSLHVTLFHGVTAPQMAVLREIARDNGSGDLHAFGTQFRVMDHPGEHSFDMRPDDLKQILAQIRTAKQASDMVMLNMHWHQNRYDFQHYSYDHFPANFEIRFAHDAIDQGVDMFVAQGVHTIKGIEIYKGKPIFYGTSNFIFQSAIMPKSKGVLRHPDGTPFAQQPKMRNFGEDGGSAHRSSDDAIVGDHETQGFWQLKPNLESFLAECRFENGKLSEVRLYPVDLGQTPRPGSQVGIPRTPTPEVAQKILDELIEYSKPFGTKIVVKDGVGIIDLN
jgi:poly-gamma-glutamate capsule biosynthesis protein CapA/YwtB (metallophosphatase superfamily)